MQARAMDNLRFIRGVMESAVTVTVISCWAQVVLGLTAIVTALVASRQSLPWVRVATWVAEAGIAAGISVFFMNHCQTRPVRRFSALKSVIPTSIPITSGLTQPSPG